MTTWHFYQRLLQPLWLSFVSVLLLSSGLWWLTGRIKLDPLCRLVITVCANYYAIFLYEFCAYHARLPQFLIVSTFYASVLVSLLHIRKEHAGKTLQTFPWHALLCWSALVIWLTGLQALILSYGGSYRYGDWYEHYELSLFYLDQWPSTARFLDGMWTLPARAPLFNTTVAFLMTNGSEFRHFQIYSSVLNSFAFLPMALLLRDIAGLSEKHALLWLMMGGQVVGEHLVEGLRECDQSVVVFGDFRGVLRECKAV